MTGRYGFGLSMLAAATIAGTQYFENKAQVKEEAPVQISLPAAQKPRSPGPPPAIPAPAKMEAPLPPPVPDVHGPIPVPSLPPEPPEPPAAPELPVAPAVVPFVTGKDHASPSSSVVAGAGVDIDTLFEGIRFLEVKGQLCLVSLEGHKEPGLSVKGHVTSDGANRVTFGSGGWKNKDFVIRYERDEEKLKVWIDVVDLETKAKVKDTGKDPSSLEFKVPHGVLVKVSNSAGDIVASRLQADSINLSTSFGNIRLDDIAAKLLLSTSSGNISATGLTGDVNARTSFGHQHYTEMKGALNAVTSSGNITVEKLNGRLRSMSSFGHHRYSHVVGPIDVTSNSGNVVVSEQNGNCLVKSSFGHQSYEKVSGDISATAKSGNIQVSGTSGKLSLETSFGHIEGEDVFLSGDSDLRSNSGNIRLKLKNPMNDLRFELTTSNGRLLIEKDNTVNKSEKSLQYGDGSILVRGVSSFGNQSYR